VSKYYLVKMRLLGWHVNKFKSFLTERGRSPLIEPFEEKEVVMKNGLLLFVGVEEEDEKKENEIIEKAVREIKKHCDNLKIDEICILPFSHLFIKLGNAEKALEIIKKLAQKLSENGFRVKRIPFGWFNELEIKAKGHPLSRIAREIR
jgi:threonyl-tRNA synthetase